MDERALQDDRVASLTGVLQLSRAGQRPPLLAGPGLLPERPAWPQSHQKHLDLTKDEHQACCELFKNQPILVRPSNKTPTLMHSLGNLTRQACASGSRNHGVQNVFLLCFIFFQTPPHAGVAVCSVLGIL